MLLNMHAIIQVLLPLDQDVKYYWKKLFSVNKPLYWKGCFSFNFAVCEFQKDCYFSDLQYSSFFVFQ